METRQAKDSQGYPYPVFKDGVTQSKAYTAAAGTITNEIASGVRLVRIWCTTDAFVKSGSSPTATTSHMPVTAKVAELMRVNEGDKISAIRSSADGTLYVTELK